MNGSLHDAAVRAELWAFSPFADAPLLAWGLAALIPIAIHLWSRRRYHEHAWAAMPFLWAVLRRQARRLWFEQWVLLAVRVLVCLLLAVVLADPVLKGLAALTPSTVDAVSTHHILVLDVSYSMGYRPGVQRGTVGIRRGTRYVLCNWLVQLPREMVSRSCCWPTGAAGGDWRTIV